MFKIGNCKETVANNLRMRWHFLYEKILSGKLNTLRTAKEIKAEKKNHGFIWQVWTNGWRMNYLKQRFVNEEEKTRSCGGHYRKMTYRNRLYLYEVRRGTMAFYGIWINFNLQYLSNTHIYLQELFFSNCYGK